MPKSRKLPKNYSLLTESAFTGTPGHRMKDVKRLKLSLSQERNNLVRSAVKEGIVPSLKAFGLDPYRSLHIKLKRMSLDEVRGKLGRWERELRKGKSLKPHWDEFIGKHVEVSDDGTETE